MEVTRVLLIDDDEDDYLLLVDYLQDIKHRIFEVEWASSYKQGLKRLRESNDFEVCLMDFLLGEKTGLDLLEQIDAANCPVPIILLTGKGDGQVDIKAMRRGATDYLVKSSVNAEKLERSIRYAIERATHLKALRENERKYRTVFNQSADLIFLFDENGILLDANPATVATVGNDAEILRGASVRSIFGGRLLNLLEKILEDGSGCSDIEVEYTTPKGDQRIGIVTLVHHIEADKPYYQGVIHDITKRKKAEQELLIAEKLAATGRFVRMLGHEIRNPLNNIGLSLEQIESEIENDDLADYLSIIKRNATRINNIITELLNTSNPGHLSFQPHSLREVMEETLDMAMDRIKLKNIKITRDYTTNAVENVAADKEKLKIALLNIVLNAIEVMSPNEGELVVRLNKINATTCRIMIEDNGIGISKDNLGRIFDAYFTSKSNGIGLGLASTLNIVQSHKGRIEVASELGKGSVFSIFLPV